MAFIRKGYVYVVSSSGGRARRLRRGVEPTWSPDGRRVAFFRTSPEPDFFGDDTTYVYVLNRRSGRVRRVSNEYVALEGAYADATSGLDWQVAR